MEGEHSNGIDYLGRNIRHRYNPFRLSCVGASPNIEFFRIILGIDSDAPGFSKLKIEPHLGDIKSISGEIPHPNGNIKVKYKVETGVLNADINLPANTTGYFVWKAKKYDLKKEPIYLKSAININRKAFHKNIKIKSITID